MSEAGAAQAGVAQVGVAQVGAEIEVADLAKGFPGTQAVDRVAFSIARGEIFGLVGPDGAGKTTVMRMLAGVMQPDSGRIEIDGVDVVKEPERAKRHLSYMPQRFGLYEDLTVDENIRFYADVFEIPRKLREARTAPLLAASNMTEFRRRLAGQLSGGMKQKLGLICALVHTPKVLLLDEPTTGVDPISRREFWSILYGLRAEGVTILISTAYLDEAERCTRLALLHRGRLAYCDTPRRLKERMPGAILRLVSSDARALRDALRGADGVRSVLLVGDGVHVAVDDGARRLPELERLVRDKGLALASIARVTPTIEDLFVSLLKDEEVPS
ncbi:MAG TPA: ABC transporter ATP-binding protein [Alphaproteobacteria bacterium]|nr:ABC transporter ATP-binding protein [Alphaproteobacteria bacterium]